MESEPEWEEEESELEELEEHLTDEEDIGEELHPGDGEDEDPFDLENESSWIINGILFTALGVLILPLASRVTTELDAVAMVMVIMYIIYTAMSGQAVNPPDPKKPQ